MISRMMGVVGRFAVYLILAVAVGVFYYVALSALVGGLEWVEAQLPPPPPPSQEAAMLPAYFLSIPAGALLSAGVLYLIDRRKVERRK